MAPSDQDSTLVKYMKVTIVNDLSTRYKGNNDFLNITTALDPRFKSLPFRTNNCRFEVFNRLVMAASTSYGRKQPKKGQHDSATDVSNHLVLPALSAEDISTISHQMKRR
ncbi:hypothetical protein ACJMK2_003591 [Sinanodonta woodiana]|uniref:Uncharacterized protein n=1 Tax=Sinanodonta woodiana TaxID=1069815 RepID=A0ABD3XYN6_SINWO